MFDAQSRTLLLHTTHFMSFTIRTVLPFLQPWTVLGLVTVSRVNLMASGNAVSLHGVWRFELDRSNTGIRDRWCERELKEKVHLPGALSAQGIGDDVSLD